MICLRNIKACFKQYVKLLMERRVGIFAGVSRRETCRRVCVNLQICFVWLDHKKILEKNRVSDPHFFADPDPGKNFHADPDPGGIRGRGVGVE